MSDGIKLVIDARMLVASGIGTYLRNLIPRLAAIVPEWHLTLIGTSEDLELLPMPTGSSVRHVQMTTAVYTPTEQVEMLFRVPKGADLLWIPHYNLPVLYRGRMVITVHDVLPLARPEFIGGRYRNLYARALFAGVAARASRVLVDSNFTRLGLLRFTAVSPHLIKTVYPGVDNAWFDVRRSPNTAKPYVVFVGNVKPHKNLRGLLRAFERLKDRISHRLLVVGRHSGFRTNDREALGLAAALGQRVEFVGEIGDEDARRLVANASALALPSHYEGFGLPPLEAMAC